LTDLDSLKRNTDLVALLESYGIALKKRGSEYDALCIAHSETNPSMQVYLKDGVQKWHCKSCGAGGTVIDAIMVLDGCDEITAIKRLNKNGFHRTERMTTTKPIKPAMNNWMHRIAPDEMPDMTTRDFGAPVATWRYNDAEGKCLGYIARYATPDGGKSYRPWTFGAYSDNVSATWKPKTWTAGKRPLYGLDELAKRPQAKVAIVEGEKAADAARQLLGAMVCITWPGGANGILSVDWSPLTGRDILLTPDADRTGVGHDAMIKVAGILLALGCKVRILDTSDQPDAWDLADAVADGWTPAQLGEWAKPRISALTSRELEQERAEAEKKTMQSAQLTGTPEPKPVPGFDEDSSIYELPPLEPEQELPHIPLTIDVQPTVLPDAPAVKPAKLKRHTAVKEAAPMAAEGEFFSDSAIAKRWAQGEGQDWKYCHQWEKWIFWNGNRWSIDKTRSAHKMVDDHMGLESNSTEANQLSKKDLRVMGSVGKISSVMKAASWHPTIRMEPEYFDADIFLLGTPEGVVDLRTGELREATRNDYITKQTLVAPQRGEHPTWDKVLARCTKGDKDTLAYFQRWWGYMLTGSCKEEAMCMIVGPGASGKTKFLMVADILGDYLQECDIALLMESKVERHSSELASLEGARIVRTTEPEEGSRFNESILKRLTGREKIAARKLYSEVHSYTVQFKIILGSNFRPSLKSTGEEIRRRIHFVDFPESIPESERDLDLDKKLQSEYPAILQWMIDGCLEWQRIGLHKPEAVKVATNAYLGEEDTLGHWLSEKCVIGPDHRISSSDAYKSYAAFVEAAGEGVVSQKRFSQRLEQRGFKPGRTRLGRHFDGLDIAIAPAPGWADREF